MIISFILRIHETNIKFILSTKLIITKLTLLIKKYPAGVGVPRRGGYLKIIDGYVIFL
jgi:hypothetical protein